MNKTKNMFLMLLILFTQMSYAQDANVSAGGDASGAGGAAAFSIGQICYTNYSGSTGSSSEGVQQAYLIATAINDKAYNQFPITIFPNPTTDVLNVTIDNYASDELFYELSEISGKVISANSITRKENQIDMHAFPDAAYVLSIFDKQKTIQSFKIIKNH